MAGRRIGEVLVSEGALTEAAVNRALGYQRVSGERLKLGSILLNWDMLAEDGLLEALSRHHRVPAAPWSILRVAPVEVTRLLPAAVAIRLGAFPYFVSKAGLHVAYVNPGDLAAQDEVSSVTGKRILPAVALEIRMLLAHQRFYGRHIPLEYRAIVERVDRRSTRTALPGGPTEDFRAQDLVETETKRDLPPPPAIRAPLANPASTEIGLPIRVEVGLADRDLPPASPRIEVPEMPVPGARQDEAVDPLSDTDPAALGKGARRRAPPDRMSDTNAVAPHSTEADLQPAANSQKGEDTVPSRPKGAGLSPSSGGPAAPGQPPEVTEEPVFQRQQPARPYPMRRASDRSREPQRERPVDGDDTLPRGAASHLRPRDVVADMWRPAPREPAGEEGADRTWAPSAAEIEASIGEARTREEIGQVALEAFLADLPRVLLLGCGKEAITGWRGWGAGLAGHEVSAIRIPLSDHNVFSDVRASGVPHFGPLEWVQWPKALADVLGERAPDCAVFPIRILDGIAAFLYVDRLGEPLHYEDFAVIARASAATANALTRFLLRRSNTAPVA